MAFALHRAAPAILASAATVVVGMLCLAFAELNSTAGLGPVLAVGIAVTFLVMVTLLPALLVICGRWMFWPKRPTFGSPEPTSHRLLGPRRAAGSRPRPRKVWVVTAGPARHRLPRAVQARRRRACRPRTPTPRSSTRSRASSCWPTTACTTPPTPSRSWPTPSSAPRSQEALAGVDGSATPVPPRTSAPGVPTSRPPIDADISSPAAFDIVEDTRDAVHGVDGADALVGGGAAFYLDTKIASTRDNKVIIPIVLIVVFLILVAAAAGADCAADPDRHGDAVVRCGAGHLGAAVRVRVRLRRAPIQGSRCSRSCSWSPWASTTTSS